MNDKFYTRRGIKTVTTNDLGYSCVVRIYKNAAGETLGMDEINIKFFSRQVTRELNTQDQEIHYGFQIMSINRTLIVSGLITDRDIAEIKVIGDFASITADSGDYKTMTWNYFDNDVVVGVPDDVSYIGDTI
jgi:hypothetical protein